MERIRSTKDRDSLDDVVCRRAPVNTAGEGLVREVRKTVQRHGMRH